MASRGPGDSEGKNQVKGSNPSREKEILKLLQKNYPNPSCALNFKTPWQLLVATILSAQCTDKRVNQVTQGLFEELKTPKDFAHIPLEQLMEMIKPTGFYRNKAKNIQASAQRIISDYKGEVPRTMEELVGLPGVGRKTANVVLGNAFNEGVGICVDTHVGRLSRRLGFTKHEDPVKVEQDLMKKVPSKDWVVISHRLIEHGRQICHARSPRCESCFLNQLCPCAFKVGLKKNS